MHDINGELSQLELLQAGTYNANTNGAGVNVSGFDGVLKVLLDASTPTGTTPVINVYAQTSPDNTNWTNAFDGNGNLYEFANVTNAANDQLQAIGIDTRDLAGYLRLVVDETGTTPSAILSASLVGLLKYR